MRLGRHSSATVSHGWSRVRAIPTTDDVAAESFFETPRTEPVKRQAYEDQEEARREAFKHIELCHGTKRMHSTLGHMGPCDLERQGA